MRHRPGLEVQIWGHLKMGIEAKRGKHPERKGNTESQHRSHKTTVSRRSLRRLLRRASSITGESRVQTGRKGSSTTCQEMSMGKAAQGGREYMSPGSPALVENVIFM